MTHKHWAALGSALVVAMVAGFSLHWHSNQPKPIGADGTKVRHLASCGSEVSPGTPWRVEGLSRRGDDLVVRATVVASCGPLTASKPQSRIHGTRLTLTWEWHIPPDAAVAACTCLKRLEFRIPGAAGVKNPAVQLTVRASD